jgi:hypothetical protein
LFCRSARKPELRRIDVMQRPIMLLVLAASLVACETQGVSLSEFRGDDGSLVRLEQYKQGGRFFYSLSAKRPTRACEIDELKLVAMGAGGNMRVRLEHGSTGACHST